MAGARHPLPAAHFRVAVEGAEVDVAEVTRLTSEDGPATVVLRRALTTSKDLFRWRERGDEADVVVSQLDGPGGEVVNAWVLVGARPVRWSGPELDALAGGIAYEELELAFDRLLWLDDPHKPPKRRRPGKETPRGRRP